MGGQGNDAAAGITVRRMNFDFPADIDTVFIEGQPEESYFNLALSFLLPYLEPYLIRTMRAARPKVKDQALLAALDKFTAQEGQHYRQHARFNQVFHQRGYDGLRPLEEELDADYQRFTKTKSLRFNLAYAEGFEAFTSQLALVAAEQDTSRWHPAALALFSWHLLEELEHRTVAFDVYQHVFGSYAYRVAVSYFAQRHLLRFTKRASTYMLERDREVIAATYGGDDGRAARERVLTRRFVRELLPRVVRTYGPRYTPHDIAMPPKMEALASRFTELAISTDRLPGSASA
jgi:uncharacterized protein